MFIACTRTHVASPVYNSVHLHLPQRKPAGLHYKCKTMLLAMKSMMLMMKLIITGKYKTVKGDSKVIYVAYYTWSHITRTRLYQIIAYFEGHLPHQKSLH